MSNFDFDLEMRAIANAVSIEAQLGRKAARMAAKLERSFLCGEIELYMYVDRVRRVDQWLEHAIARAREE